MSASATEVPGSGAVSGQAGRARHRGVRYELALAAGCYLIAAFAVMLLVWKDPASRTVAGDPGDPNLCAWWIRYAASEVAHWRLPALVTDGMNAPAGVSAMWNVSLLAPGVVLTPVTLLAGPQVSLNVLLTAGFAGSATSMYWVLRRWSCAVPPAALGGLAYGFSPALTQAAIGHYHLQFAVLPPLIAHALLRLPRDPRYGALLGALAALQLFVSEEILFNTGVAIAIMLVVLALSRLRIGGYGGSPSRGSTAWPTGLAASAGSGLLIATGVFTLLAGYPLWTQFLGPLAEHGNPFVLDFYKNDLLGFVKPSSLELIHSASTAAFARQSGTGMAEYVGYLGWPMLFTLAWASVALWRVLPVRMLAAAFVVLEAFSLGGTLQYAGHVHSWIKLPWYWLQELPVAVSVIADRFSVTADGCAAALLAFALQAAWTRTRREPAGDDAVASGEDARPGPGAARRFAGRDPVMARVAVTVAGLVAVAGMLPAPLPTASLQPVPPGWARVLGDLRLPYGASVLTLPAPGGAFTTPLRWQADTGMPSAMVGGYFIGPVAGGRAYVGGPGLAAPAKWLNWLWLESGPGLMRTLGLESSALVVPAGQVRAWLISSHLSAVVAVTGADTPLASYLDQLLGPPAARSGAVIAWRVRLPATRLRCRLMPPGPRSGR